MTDEDNRIIVDTGVDARIAGVVEPVVTALGFRLVRVRLTGQHGATVQIFAERNDGTMTVEDCEELSRAISPALDVDDPVDGAYALEVSSPGIDRPLVRKSDFSAWQGHLAKIETAAPVEGKKRFRGKIGDVSADGFVLERDQASYGDAPAVDIPFDALVDAKLVLTDELVRDALTKDKKARQARERDGERMRERDGENDDATEEQTNT